MSNNNESLAKEINTKIIDYILASPINIDMIPDDIERKMHETILNVILFELDRSNDPTGCVQQSRAFFKKLFSCCKSNRKTFVKNNMDDEKTDINN